MADFKSERAQLQLLEKYCAEKNFSEALVMGERLIGEYPASFPLKLLYARALKAMGRLIEAEQMLVELGRIYPDNINLLGEIGDLYLKQKKFEDSLPYFNRILFLDSFNEQARTSVRTVQDFIRNKALKNLEDTLLEVRVSERMFHGPEPAAQTEPPAEEPVAAGESGEAEPMPEIFISVEEETFGKAGPKAETSVEELPVPVAAEPAGVAPEPEDLDFETETAAELYLRQGLYGEARRIYHKLYERSADPNFLARIQQIDAREQGGGRREGTIERLNRFLQLVQKRGNDLV